MGRGKTGAAESQGWFKVLTFQGQSARYLSKINLASKGNSINTESL